MFPTSGSGPLDIYYECVRTNSNLYYYLHLRRDNTLTWQFEVDTGQQFLFNGAYTHNGGEIHVQIVDPGFPLDETSTNTTSLMGLVYTIDTPITHCEAVGHGYDTTLFPRGGAFSVPNLQPGTRQRSGERVRTGCGECSRCDLQASEHLCAWIGESNHQAGIRNLPTEW